jgi:hypothetical protein
MAAPMRLTTTGPRERLDLHEAEAKPYSALLAGKVGNGVSFLSSRIRMT